MVRAGGRRDGAPGCAPTEQEALVLAEVLQRDLAIRDADPTALSQVPHALISYALLLLHWGDPAVKGASTGFPVLPDLPLCPVKVDRRIQ